MTRPTAPVPLFDTLTRVAEQDAPELSGLPTYCTDNYHLARSFLLSYNGSQATFNAYRREVERLLHWSWLVHKQSILNLRRADIETYLAFVQQPPKAWIGTKKTPRFINQGGMRIANPDWRPFVATISKSARRSGKQADSDNYSLSEVALKEVFAILSSFYNFMIQEEVTSVNPIAHIRQKSKFLRKRQGKAKIRRLSELQWHYVVETADQMAQVDPDKHERTLFIISALFLMYLRISELTASERWTPQMHDFHCDHDGLWWFTVVGKGNKERDIAVSDAMLDALRRWRRHLGLPGLPTAADHSPLIPKLKGHGGISNTSFVRKIVQHCFDTATERMLQAGLSDEAQALTEATVHWLRHTGISEDVKSRPREHVRDDAGHSSGATTDKYIDIERKARHASAKTKPLK